MQKDIQQEPDYNNSIMKPFISPAAAGFFGLILVFVLYQFGGAILTLLIFGMDYEQADKNALRLLTTGSQLLFILLPGLILSKAIFNNVTRAIRVKFPKWKELGMFTLGMIILTPLLQSYMYLQTYLIDWAANNSSIMESVKSVLDEFDKMLESSYADLLQPSNILEGVLIFVVVAIVPSLCEEVFFRGYVQRCFEIKYKTFYGALITAVFFGLYHFNPYGLLPLIALGFYFGFAAYKSDSLLVPMVLHFLNNFVSFIAFLIIGSEELQKPLLGNTDMLVAEGFSFLLLLSLFFLFIFIINKHYRKSSTNQGGQNDMS